MNKSEFIKELEYCLRHLPKEDREDAISYYEEYIGEMGLEDYEDVTVKLGNPKEVAKAIIGDCTAKAVEEQKESKSVKGSGRVVWLIILGIFSLPLSLPIAIVIFALALTFLIVIFAVLLALGVGGLALFVAGIVGLFKALFVGGLASIVLGLGIGLAFAGIGVLIAVGTVELFKGFVGLLGRLFSNRRDAKQLEE